MINEYFRTQVLGGGMMDQQHLDRIVSALGGWPDYLCAIGRARGDTMIAVTIQRRIIDQAVFVLVSRWALHQAEFDKLSTELAAERPAQKSGDAYLSGEDQRRAYHENRAAALETQLLATPYQRIRAGLSAQTDFLDQFDAPAPSPDGHGASEGPRTVTPFRPRTKKNGL